MTMNKHVLLHLISHGDCHAIVDYTAIGNCTALIKGVI